jgi:signal transduction histidine kinase
LQGVVAALLALFRSGGGAQVQRVDVAALFARLPAAGLVVRLPMPADGALFIDADEDLLAAALVNLLDNALRHGAKSVTVSMPAPRALRLHDDGPGVDAARRARLAAELAADADGTAPAAAPAAAPDHAGLGLGLALAARVAQAHGGQVLLPVVGSGFAVELWFGGPAPGPGSAASADAAAPTPSAGLQGAAAH